MTTRCACAPALLAQHQRLRALRGPPCVRARSFAVAPTLNWSVCDAALPTGAAAARRGCGDGHEPRPADALPAHLRRCAQSRSGAGHTSRPREHAARALLRCSPPAGWLRALTQPARSLQTRGGGGRGAGGGPAAATRGRRQRQRGRGRRARGAPGRRRRRGGGPVQPARHARGGPHGPHAAGVRARHRAHRQPPRHRRVRTCVLACGFRWRSVLTPAAHNTAPRSYDFGGRLYDCAGMKRDLRPFRELEPVRAPACGSPPPLSWRVC